MKIIKKISIAIISMFLIICQLNISTYAYTISEVKGIIGFKIIETGNEPEYDIKIDAKDMIDNEKLPCIKTTLETVLYSEDGLLNVDFLNKRKKKEDPNAQKATLNIVDQTDKKNSNEQNNGSDNSKEQNNNNSNQSQNSNGNSVAKKVNQEEYISNLVKTIFKVSLAISVMAMLTLLIYIGITTVSESISGKISFFKFLSIFNNKNPQKKLKQKKALEEWFKSMILMTIIVLIINLFSGGIQNLTNLFNDKKISSDSIGVYVVNSSAPSDKNDTTSSSISSGDLDDLLKDGTWGVYAKNLNSNKDIENINEEEQMSSASVIKLFIAAAAYHKQKESIQYKVDEKLMAKMISESNNDAANSIIKDVKKDYINDYLKKNDYTKTELNRDFGVTIYSKDNLTSARDVGRLLEKIYTNQCEGAEEILKYMKAQTHRNKIPAGIPEGIDVANKTGELSSDYPNYPVENDAAIVYKQDSNFILVALSTGTKDSDTAIDTIKQLSERVYVKAGGASEQEIGSGSEKSATSNSTLQGTAESQGLRKKVLEVANSGQSLGAGSYECEVWVEQVYRTALDKDDSVITRHLCAHEAGEASNNGNGPYADSNNIVPGAAVFSYKSWSNYNHNGHDAGHIGIYIGDGKIASWLGSHVGISTMEEWNQNWHFDGWGWITGTEYLGDGAGANDLSSSKNKKINYFFKTGIEGLLMFKSQYNWNKYAGKNFKNIIAGGLLSIIKILLYAVFFIRMAILAVITAFGPIIILVNTFKKLSGSKGYIENWFKLYLFLTLLRPMIAFLYYILVDSKKYLAVEFPEYVVFASIIIIIATCKLIKLMINDLRGKKQSNKILKKA